LTPVYQEIDNPPMNWQKLITDIQRSGMTQAQIGAAVGRTQGWVAGIMSVSIKTVRWEDGQKLIQLHAERCKQDSSWVACRLHVAGSTGSK
jgi:hypothetical protein